MSQQIELFKTSDYTDRALPLDYGTTAKSTRRKQPPKPSPERVPIDLYFEKHSLRIFQNFCGSNIAEIGPNKLQKISEVLVQLVAGNPIDRAALSPLCQQILTRLDEMPETQLIPLAKAFMNTIATA